MRRRRSPLPTLPIFWISRPRPRSTSAVLLNTPGCPALDRELDNFREVIRRGIESGRVETALRLTIALTDYWVSRSYQKEGRRYLEELLAMPSQDVTPASRAAALEAVVDIAVRQGDYAMARPLIEQALARYREFGDATGIAVQLQSLGYALSVIDPEEARGLFAESIEALRAVGSHALLGGEKVGEGVGGVPPAPTRRCREDLRGGGASFPGGRRGQYAVHAHLSAWPDSSASRGSRQRLATL